MFGNIELKKRTVDECKSMYVNLRDPGLPWKETDQKKFWSLANKRFKANGELTREDFIEFSDKLKKKGRQPKRIFNNYCSRLKIFYLLIILKKLPQEEWFSVVQQLQEMNNSFRIS